MLRCCRSSTIRYSVGNTLTNFLVYSSHLPRIRRETSLSVYSPCRTISACTCLSSSWLPIGPSSTIPGLQREANEPSSSSTYATPPLMPAAKLRPVLPSTTTNPRVMYSHPWSPTPSTTACAPLLRTANRSPATPRKNASPPVAPYSATLPTMMFSSALKVASFGGRTEMNPPDSPLPQ